MRANFERALRTGFAAVALVMCCLSPAQAVRYASSYDPFYGFPFENLGWSGEAVFFVPDNCVPGLGANRIYTILDSCGQGSYVESAFVDLYEGTNELRTSEERLTFSVSPLSLVILSLRFEGPELKALFTLPSNWVPSETLAPNKDFSLWFVDFRLLSQNGYSGPLLLSRPCEESTADGAGFGSSCEFAFNVNDYVDNPPIFKITQIPEPGSLALLAGALIATAWGPRFRRRTGPAASAIADR